MIGNELPSRPTGRPPGHNATTLARAREIAKMMTDYGIPAETIIQKEGIPRSSLYRLLGLVREDAAAADQAPAETNPPAPRRRMSLGAVLARAWRYGHERLMQLGAAVNSLWTRIVVAIHEDGDGVRLHVGEHGYRFQGRAEVAKLLPGHRPEDIDDWMGMLFRHGYLVEFGDDIALPLGHGLTPGEGVRGRRRFIGDPVFPGAEAWGGGNQRPAMQVVQGGLTADGQPDRGADGEGLYRDKPSQNSPDKGLFQDENSQNSPDKVAVFRDSAGLADAAKSTTTTTTKILESLDFSSRRRSDLPSVPPEGESQERATLSGLYRDSNVGLFRDSDPGPAVPPQPVPEPDETGDPAVTLAREIGALCGYGEPTAADAQTVREWLDLPGASAAMILRAIREDRDKPDPLPVRALALFTRTIKGASSVEHARQTRAGKPPPPAVPALSAEDQTIQDRIKPVHDAWMRDLQGCPFAPSLDDYKAAQRNGDGRLVDRWFDAWHAWDAIGRPARLKPPDFTLLMQARRRFDERLLDCEEDLTRPGPRPAAPR